MRSKPDGSTSSSIPSTRSATCGRSVSTVRGVNALLTSFRSRVWSGGSIISIERGRSMPSAELAGTAAACGGWSGSELKVGSRSTRSQSAHRVRTYSSHSGNALIGVSARIRW